jgi:CRP-like cAMP-binding protein
MGTEQRQKMALKLIGLEEAVGQRILMGRFELTGASGWPERSAGFLLHTVQGRDVFCYCASSDERDEWLKAVAAGVTRTQAESLVERCELQWDEAAMTHAGGAEQATGRGAAVQSAAALSGRMLKPRVGGSKQPTSLGDSLSAVPLQSMQRTRRATVTVGGGIRVDAAALRDGRGERVESGDSEDDENGSLIVTQLCSGAFFGEAALLTKSPRNASVVASEPCTLLRLSQANFHNFLRIMPDVQRTIHNAVKRRYAERLRALALPFLAGFDDGKMQLLADRGKLVTFGHGHILFSQGSTGSSFYIILHGSVAVVIQGQGTSTRRVVSLLRSGDYFGEVALLRSTPRAATIVARETTTLLELTQKDFIGLFLGSGAARQLESPVVASERARQNTVHKGATQLPPPTMSTGTAMTLAEAVSLSGIRGVAGLRRSEDGPQGGGEGVDTALLMLAGMAADQSEAFADFELRLFKEQAELRHVLHHTEGLAYFKLALQSEFSAENVHFWSQVQVFRARWLPLIDALPIQVQDALLRVREAGIKSGTPHPREGGAKRKPSINLHSWLHSAGDESLQTVSQYDCITGIVDSSDVLVFSTALLRVLSDVRELVRMFIAEAAPTQVNLNSRNRRSIERLASSLEMWAGTVSSPGADSAPGGGLPSCSPVEAAATYLHLARRLLQCLTIFDEAQAEIYELMNKDNFSRFKKSEQFRQLLEGVNPYRGEGASRAAALKRTLA